MNKLEYFKISIKNFKGFKNVQKSIETNGDLSVLWPITFQGPEIPYRMGLSALKGDFELLILEEMWYCILVLFVLQICARLELIRLVVKKIERSLLWSTV